MSNDQLARNLSGNSGCEVKIIRSSNKPNLVRKTSPSLSYNHRLEKQFRLQSIFSSSIAKSPSIVNVGENELGLKYFEMQYIPGLNLHEAICASDFEQIKVWAKNMGEILKEFSEKDLQEETQLIFQKLSDLEDLLYGKIGSEVDGALKYLQNFNWEMVPNTTCHGDLSFENILIYKNEIYLIDFQDIFYSSWLQDLAKIKFDIESNWSGIRRNLPNLQISHQIKLKYFMEIVQTSAREIQPDMVELEFAQFHLELLHILRIIPYCSDSKIRDHLLSMLKYMLHTKSGKL